MSKPVTEAQLRKRVKVRRLFEVECNVGTCNGMQDELVDTREEAERDRENHIQLHLQGAFSMDDDDEKEGWM